MSIDVLFYINRIRMSIIASYLFANINKYATFEALFLYIFIFII